MSNGDQKNKTNMASDEMSEVVSDKKTISAMKKLLSDDYGSVDDKIATVKTAQVVDKGRFESAFKTLMNR